MESRLNEYFSQALAASRRLGRLSEAEINRMLLKLADVVVEASTDILLENQKDLARMDAADPKFDRLKLTEARIAAIASDLRNVASLPSPLNRILSSEVLPNKLKLKKITVPFGVIGIVYEARPNVTLDVFSLCVKSGNAVVLKGGSDAQFSNEAIVSLIKRVLRESSIDENALVLLPPTREATTALLHARGFVDLIIPRGSQALIDYVRENATIPVIETGAGICHTYFDVAGDKDLGRVVIHNAKTRRVSVCNALDCLIIHKDRLADLPHLVGLMKESGVEIYADPEALASLQGNYPAEWLHPAVPASFGTEFLDYKMAVKTVSSLDDALDHIARFGSKHSEAIISADRATIGCFFASVDAAAVYANTSTAYTDGAQFGLGAEIGISTQKLHARGPMALQEITTYKWIVEGEGQVRE